MRLLIILACLASTWCFGQRQKEISYKTKFNGKIVDVLVYVPVGYDPKSTQKYPAMIWHHGMGEKCWECGESTSAYDILAKQANGLTRVIEDGLDLPFIVFSPRCIFGGPDNPTINGQSVYRPAEWTNELFDTLCARYPKADKSNLFLGGLSMGGASVMEYVCSKLAKPLKGAIVCSGWCPNDSLLSNFANNKIPLYDSRAEFDATGGLASSMQVFYSKGITKGALKPKMIVYNGSSHDAGWVNFLANNNSVVSTKTWDIATSSNNKWQDWVMSKTMVIAPPIAATPPIVVSPPVGNGTGLQATYSYSATTTDASGLVTNCTFTSSALLKSKIDLQWANGQVPAPGIRYNNWQLSLSGFIKVPTSDEYTFYVTSDDGSKLSIAGANVTSDYVDHSARTTQGKILMGTEKCAIKLDYYNAWLEGALKLEYSTATTPKQLVPVEWLFAQ